VTILEELVGSIRTIAELGNNLGCGTKLDFSEAEFQNIERPLSLACRDSSMSHLIFRDNSFALTENAKVTKYDL